MVADDRPSSLKSECPVELRRRLFWDHCSSTKPTMWWWFARGNRRLPRRRIYRHRLLMTSIRPTRTLQHYLCVHTDFNLF